MAAKAPLAVDVHVGARIRTRRLLRIVNDFFSDRRAVRLASHFNSIENDDMRSAIVRLVEVAAQKKIKRAAA